MFLISWNSIFCYLHLIFCSYRSFVCQYLQLGLLSVFGIRELTISRIITTKNLLVRHDLYESESFESHFRGGSQNNKSTLFSVSYILHRKIIGYKINLGKPWALSIVLNWVKRGCIDFVPDGGGPLIFSRALGCSRLPSAISAGSATRRRGQPSTPLQTSSSARWPKRTRMTSWTRDASNLDTDLAFVA